MQGKDDNRLWNLAVVVMSHNPTLKLLWCIMGRPSSACTSASCSMSSSFMLEKRNALLIHWMNWADLDMCWWCWWMQNYETWNIMNIMNQNCRNVSHSIPAVGVTHLSSDSTSTTAACCTPTCTKASCDVIRHTGLRRCPELAEIGGKLPPSENFLSAYTPLLHVNTMF